MFIGLNSGGEASSVLPSLGQECVPGDEGVNFKGTDDVAEAADDPAEKLVGR